MDPSMLKIELWGLGICFTGFMFLVGWVIKLQVQVKECVTYKWLEEKFEKDIKDDLDKVVKVLEEIKGGLVGSMEHPEGLFTKTNRLEKDVQNLKDKVYAK